MRCRGSGSWGRGWSPSASSSTGSRTSAPSGLRDKVLSAHVGLGWPCCHPRPRVLTDTQRGQKAGFMAKNTLDKRLKEPKQLSVHPVLKGLKMALSPIWSHGGEPSTLASGGPTVTSEPGVVSWDTAVRLRRDTPPTPGLSAPGRQRALLRSLAVGASTTLPHRRAGLAESKSARIK